MTGTAKDMKTTKKQIIYGEYAPAAGENLAVAEDAYEYTAVCPVCAKRVLDVSALPRSPVSVRLKCPHCRKIVRIPFRAASP